MIMRAIDDEDAVEGTDERVEQIYVVVQPGWSPSRDHRDPRDRNEDHRHQRVPRTSSPRQVPRGSVVRWLAVQAEEGDDQADEEGVESIVRSVATYTSDQSFGFGTGLRPSTIRPAIARICVG